MGEKQTKQLSFNGFRFPGIARRPKKNWTSVPTSGSFDEYLSDSRQGLNKKFTLADLLRQSIYSRGRLRQRRLCPSVG